MKAESSWKVIWSWKFGCDLPRQGEDVEIQKRMGWHVKSPVLPRSQFLKVHLLSNMYSFWTYSCEEITDRFISIYWRFILQKEGKREGWKERSRKERREGEKKTKNQKVKSRCHLKLPDLLKNNEKN